MGRLYGIADFQVFAYRFFQLLLAGIAASGDTIIADGFNEWIGWGPAPDTGVESDDYGDSWRTFAIHQDFDTNAIAMGNGRFVAVGCFGNEHACQGFAEGAEGAIFSTP